MSPIHDIVWVRLWDNFNLPTNVTSHTQTNSPWSPVERTIYTPESKTWQLFLAVDRTGYTLFDLRGAPKDTIAGNPIDGYKGTEEEMTDTSINAWLNQVANLVAELGDNT